MRVNRLSLGFAITLSTLVVLEFMMGSLNAKSESASSGDPLRVCVESLKKAGVSEEAMKAFYPVSSGATAEERQAKTFACIEMQGKKAVDLATSCPSGNCNADGDSQPERPYATRYRAIQNALSSRDDDCRKSVKTELFKKNSPAIMALCKAQKPGGGRIDVDVWGAEGQIAKSRSGKFEFKIGCRARCYCGENEKTESACPYYPETVFLGEVNRKMACENTAQARRADARFYFANEPGKKGEKGLRRTNLATKACLLRAPLPEKVKESSQCKGGGKEYKEDLGALSMLGDASCTWIESKCAVRCDCKTGICFGDLIALGDEIEKVIPAAQSIDAVASGNLPREEWIGKDKETKNRIYLAGSSAARPAVWAPPGRSTLPVPTSPRPAETKPTSDPKKERPEISKTGSRRRVPHHQPSETAGASDVGTRLVLGARKVYATLFQSCDALDVQFVGDIKVPETYPSTYQGENKTRWGQKRIRVYLENNPVLQQMGGYAGAAPGCYDLRDNPPFWGKDNPWVGKSDMMDLNEKRNGRAGIDCIGFIGGALAAAGLRFRSKDPYPFNYPDTVHFRDWAKQSTGCFQEVQLDENTVLQKGDVVVADRNNQHAAIIEDVGPDPLGIEGALGKNRECSSLSYRDFDFAVIHSSIIGGERLGPHRSKLGLGGRRAVLDLGNGIEKGLEAIARKRCEAAKKGAGESAGKATATGFSLLRHKGTPECIARPAKVKDFMPCLKNCADEFKTLDSLPRIPGDRPGDHA